MLTGVQFAGKHSKQQANRKKTSTERIFCLKQLTIMHLHVKFQLDWEGEWSARNRNYNSIKMFIAWQAQKAQFKFFTEIFLHHQPRKKIRAD